MRVLFLTIVTLASLAATAQTNETNRFTIGLEQDFLPYAAGGYYAGIWAGKSHIRVRALLAGNVHKPEFIVPDGYANNRVTALAVVADYYLRQGWKGWWLSGGLVHWNSSIQDENRTTTANYTNILINGSLGYQWRFYRHFYLSPWAGVHFLVGGDKTVSVGSNVFKPAVINPEASLKVGWYF